MHLANDRSVPQSQDMVNRNLDQLVQEYIANIGSTLIERFPNRAALEKAVVQEVN
jgi:hypothetical protein